MAEHDTRSDEDEGEPTGEPSPVTPDDSEPSEQDLEEDLPGVPEEAEND
jgi:hypothetical protein